MRRLDSACFLLPCLPCSQIARRLVLRLVSLTIEAFNNTKLGLKIVAPSVGNKLEPRALGLLGVQPSHLNPHAFLKHTKVLQLCSTILESWMLAVSCLYPCALTSTHVGFNMSIAVKPLEFSSRDVATNDHDQ